MNITSAFPEPELVQLSGGILQAELMGLIHGTMYVIFVEAITQGKYVGLPSTVHEHMTDGKLLTICIYMYLVFYFEPVLKL